MAVQCMFFVEKCALFGQKVTKSTCFGRFFDPQNTILGMVYKNLHRIFRQNLLVIKRGDGFPSLYYCFATAIIDKMSMLLLTFGGVLTPFFGGQNHHLGDEKKSSDYDHFIAQNQQK